MDNKFCNILISFYQRFQASEFHIFICLKEAVPSTLHRFRSGSTYSSTCCNGVHKVKYIPIAYKKDPHLNHTPVLKEGLNGFVNNLMCIRLLYKFIINNVEKLH